MNRSKVQKLYSLYSQYNRFNIRGFTLIELMLVIALCALVATLSISYLGFLDRMIMRSELEKLRTTCLYLQRHAMLEGQVQQLDFDQELPGYKHNKSMYKFPAQVQFGLLPTVLGPPSSPVQVPNSPITFSKNSMQFFSDGTITPGTVYLIDRKKHCIYALSCSVGGGTGLNGYYYDNSWHLLF